MEKIIIEKSDIESSDDEIVPKEIPLETPAEIPDDEPTPTPKEKKDKFIKIKAFLSLTYVIMMSITPIQLVIKIELL